MMEAILISAFAGLIALWALPTALQLIALTDDFLRYPLKVQQLSRISVALEQLCRRRPDVAQAPEFCDALIELTQALLAEAARSRYPLDPLEVIDAAVLGIEDSQSLSPQDLGALERTLQKSARQLVSRSATSKAAG